MFLRKLYYLFPSFIQLIIRRIYYIPVDIFEKATDKRDKYTPPRGLLFVGYGDFKKTGEVLINQIRQVCNLLPDERILDIGCGIGRLAVPLTKFLNEIVSYEGFDIVKQGIKRDYFNFPYRFKNNALLDKNVKETNIAD